MPEDQPANDRGASFAGLPRALKRRLLAGAVLRAGITTTILLTAYVVMPFTLISQARYLTGFLIGAAVVLAVLAVEFSRTMRSPYPRLRAVESLLTAGPLFIVLFATAHYVIGQLDPTGYTEPMTRLDALYFTVTTFATVGYGDISPHSDIARLVAMVQMVSGLVLVGVVAKLLFGIAQESDHRRRLEAPADRR
ncbi:MAG TPA: ion channel [Microlunatus sp.]|jgi:voltage-gated potassium channel|nr:ion channel [Microlunatus sp.]